MASTVIPALRRRCAVCLLLWLTAAPLALAEPLTSVADLRYGAVLYQYYQNNYFNALVELMLAETRGGIKGHRENPRLIEGGISLAFGMERKAEAIFNDLLTAEQPGEVRTAAWYYLARLRYLHGDWNGSASILQRLDVEHGGSLQTQLKSLQINLHLRQGRVAEADALLQDFPRSDALWPYHVFNLGSAYSRRQQHPQAQHYYSSLVQHARHNFSADEMAPVSIEQQQQELLALYDKAKIAAGYNAMLARDYGVALANFSRVRQQSHFSSAALLGYGWAAFQQQDYALALSPWQQLSGAPINQAAVQEATLALPYAYEQMGAAGQALQGYRQAEQRLQVEQARLQSLQQGLLAASGKAGLRSLLQRLPVDNTGWLLPQQASPAEAAQDEWAELLAQDYFQTALGQLEDVLVLQRYLQQWQQQLDIYQWTWEERYTDRKRKQALLLQQPWRQQGEQLRQQQEQLQSRLSRVAQERDYLALAPAEAADNWRVVQRMQANIEHLREAGRPVAEFENAARMFGGILLWQASQSFVDTQWRSRKDLRAAEQALSSLAQHQQRVEQTLAAAADIAPFEARIADLKRRLEVQSQRVDMAVATAEQQLIEQMSAWLRDQRLRLNGLLAQARLAQARIYDSALEQPR